MVDSILNIKIQTPTLSGYKYNTAEEAWCGVVKYPELLVDDVTNYARLSKKYPDEWKSIQAEMATGSEGQARVMLFKLKLKDIGVNPSVFEDLSNLQRNGHAENLNCP